jgi:GTP-binding protein LepA C-terminus
VRGTGIAVRGTGGAVRETGIAVRETGIAVRGMGIAVRGTGMGHPVDALSLILHRDKAYARGKVLVEKMKELISRQLFEVVLQAVLRVD